MSCKKPRWRIIGLVASLSIATVLLVAPTAGALKSGTQILVKNAPGVNCQLWSKGRTVCSGPTFPAGNTDYESTRAWKVSTRGRVGNTHIGGLGHPVKRYGKGKRFTWKGVKCTVLSNGIRCKNKSGRGFKITSRSRKKF